MKIKKTKSRKRKPGKLAVVFFGLCKMLVLAFTMFGGAIPLMNSASTALVVLGAFSTLTILFGIIAVAYSTAEKYKEASE